ncbi:hypothetical protein CFIMG_008673RA00001 [Ceratocystis fimbriata CBS 114723]|uniref:Uncharacterized protein n=1 Tax=Ceratocystis fimbriata CBS 114723 TaxID=1035309 RepID=A0A2C5X0E9_9PEZI|nr:hypothetical protein CFIMG_008673RA00001 [Ceratocystis fimbriata CBS 114723]
MILHHLLHIVTFPWTRGRGPSPNNGIQPTQVAGLDPTNTATVAEVIETAIVAEADDPYDPDYLSQHGYMVLKKEHGGVFIGSGGYSGDINKPVLKLYIDVKRQVTTIYENNLRYEKASNENLKVHDIFQAVCHQQHVQFDDMRWIVMDVDDPFIYTAIRNYRIRNGLEQNEEIIVTPDHIDWKILYETVYYAQASKMVPGAQIDKIIVRRRQREMYTGRYSAVIADVIIFSLKTSPLENESSDIDPIDAHEAELADEAALNKAMDDADNALKAELLAAKYGWKL